MASLLFVSADDSLIISQISMLRAQSSASKLGSVACSVDDTKYFRMSHTLLEGAQKVNV